MAVRALVWSGKKSRQPAGQRGKSLVTEQETWAAEASALEIFFFQFHFIVYY